MFSEPFATRSAAQRVAEEQHVPGDTTQIVYQDETGGWHEELSEGDDRGMQMSSPEAIRVHRRASA